MVLEINGEKRGGGGSNLAQIKKIVETIHCIKLLGSL